MTTAQWLMKSEMGSFYLVASEKGLRQAFTKKRAAPMASSLTGKSPEIQILAQAVRQLEEFFAGKRKKFSIPLDIQGTEFQKKVWTQLSQIPYGKTQSYKDIAYKIKNKNATRAVGTANGKNPLCIFVPCHRVIAADGTLGGVFRRPFSEEASASFGKSVAFLKRKRSCYESHFILYFMDAHWL